MFGGSGGDLLMAGVLENKQPLPERTFGEATSLGKLGLSYLISTQKEGRQWGEVMGA